MTTRRHAVVPVLGHEIQVTDQGRPGAEPLVMRHGLARTGRDFDDLARALSHNFFVLCAGTIGRGLSSWSDNPEAEHCLDFYTGIAAGLFDHYGLDRVGWIGTSMGALMGMRMTSGRRADRLAWLIVNDIGPVIPREAISRTLEYADSAADFATLSAAEAWFRAAYAPFGPADDAFWQHMARTSVRCRADVRLTTHYDPVITMQFTASPGDLTSWDRYERITLPMHVLRGASSDILRAGTAKLMAASGPRPEITLYRDCGHAPSLSRPEDHARLREIIADLTRRRPGLPGAGGRLRRVSPGGGRSGRFPAGTGQPGPLPHVR